ncbi:hypothetical protein D3C78_1111210 [compost metagenome]
MRLGRDVQSVGRIGVFRRDIDESAAIEVRLLHPGGNELDVGQRSLRRRGRVHRLAQARHELPVAPVQRRLDQLLLAGEMTIEGFLGHAGNLAELLDASGVIALPIEQP